MVLKKPILWASCTHLNAVAYPNFQSQTHSAVAPNPSPRSSKVRRRHAACHYATISGDDPSSISPDLIWPSTSAPYKPLTPYQIFNQKRSDPYSKRRFYELVKIYHPDRNGHRHDVGCDHTLMLERYRLVIAANAILSDPVKRKAYDQFGYGWDDRHGSDPSCADADAAYKYSTYHRWRTSEAGTWQWPVNQDPMYNATWEDWERWYCATNHPNASASSHSWSSTFFSSKPHQRSVYVNNHAFFSLVFLLAALGGVGQATRVRHSSNSRTERSKIVNDETSRVLMKARQDSLDNAEGGENKDGRIRRFMRENEMYNKGEFDARVLKKDDGNLCASGTVKAKDEPRFWERPPENR